MSKSSAASHSQSVNRDGRSRRPMHRIYEIHALIFEAFQRALAGKL
jgi:hypothetical protein